MSPNTFLLGISEEVSAVAQFLQVPESHFGRSPGGVIPEPSPLGRVTDLGGADSRLVFKNPLSNSGTTRAPHAIELEEGGMAGRKQIAQARAFAFRFGQQLSEKSAIAGNFVNLRSRRFSSRPRPRAAQRIPPRAARRVRNSFQRSP